MAKVFAWECDICKKLCRSERGLTIHMKTSLDCNSKKRLTKCEHNWKRIGHFPNEKITCINCGKVCTCDIFTHDKDDPDIMVCDVCGYN